MKAEEVGWERHSEFSVLGIFFMEAGALRYGVLLYFLLCGCALIFCSLSKGTTNGSVLFSFHCPFTDSCAVVRIHRFTTEAESLQCVARMGLV